MGAAPRRFVAGWDLILRGRGDGLMAGRFTFAADCPVRFFAANGGEFGVRGVLPSRTLWSLWGEVDAAMLAVRQLSPQS